MFSSGEYLLLSFEVGINGRFSGGVGLLFKNPSGSVLVGASPNKGLGFLSNTGSAGFLGGSALSVETEGVGAEAELGKIGLLNSPPGRADANGFGAGSLGGAVVGVTAVATGVGSAGLVGTPKSVVGGAENNPPGVGVNRGLVSVVVYFLSSFKAANNPVVPTGLL